MENNVISYTPPEENKFSDTKGYLIVGAKNADPLKVCYLVMHNETVIWKTFSSRRAECTVQNVKTTPALFRANTPLKRDLHVVVCRKFTSYGYFLLSTPCKTSSIMYYCCFHFVASKSSLNMILKETLSRVYCWKHQDHTGFFSEPTLLPNIY